MTCERPNEAGVPEALRNSAGVSPLALPPSPCSIASAIRRSAATANTGRAGPATASAQSGLGAVGVP